jgi:L-ribulose-5-phosphate 3-epimerase
MTIKLTGFADEASSVVAEQIKAHKSLGWDSIEMRMVGDLNFTNLDDAAYASVKDELLAAGIGVSAFGSAIANWARTITGDFKLDLDDLKRAVPRMQELGTKFIRVMSYPNDEKNPLSEEEWLREAASRIKKLAVIAEAEDLILVHENCSGYGALSPVHMLKLIAAVDSPAFKMVFDTGNQTAHQGYDNPDLSWEYYQAIRQQIVHVHIKDNAPDPEGQARQCFPGQGQSQVKKIVSDLVATGYDGYLSIEPHMKGQVHLGDDTGSASGAFDLYVEYGQRTATLLTEVMAE